MYLISGQNLDKTSYKIWSSGGYAAKVFTNKPRLGKEAKIILHNNFSDLYRRKIAPKTSAGFDHTPNALHAAMPVPLDNPFFAEHLMKIIPRF